MDRIDEGSEWRMRSAIKAEDIFKEFAQLPESAGKTQLGALANRLNKIPETKFQEARIEILTVISSLSHTLSESHPLDQTLIGHLDKVMGAIEKDDEAEVSKLLFRHGEI